MTQSLDASVNMCYYGLPVPSACPSHTVASNNRSRNMITSDFWCALVILREIWNARHKHKSIAGLGWLVLCSVWTHYAHRCHLDYGLVLGMPLPAHAGYMANPKIGTHFRGTS